MTHEAAIGSVDKKTGGDFDIPGLDESGAVYVIVIGILNALYRSRYIL